MLFSRHPDRSPKPEFEPDINELFVAVSNRYEEALGLDQNSQQERYIVLNRSTSKSANKFAIFNVVVSHDEYRINSGEVIEVYVPTNSLEVDSSPLLLLTELNPDRYFILVQHNASQSPRFYKFTNGLVEPVKGTKTVELPDSLGEYMGKLQGPNQYEIVSLMSRYPQEIPDDAITET